MLGLAPGKSDSTGRAFTLVELLVVIGVIAVLVGIFVPVLAAARRQSNRTVCAANLREIGNAFALYAHDNAGFWPMSEWKWKGPDGTDRDKYWSHFISRYVGQSLNEDGTDPKAERFIKDTHCVQWGCPSWSRAAFNTTSNAVAYNLDANNGYAMNHYPFAPVSVTGSATTNSNLALRNPIPPTYAFDGSASSVGWFYKAVQWKQPAERALIFDNTHGLMSVKTAWPWWTPTTAPMPDKPNILSGFTVDFNRHGPRERGNKENDPAINMLFCDGHVTTVSAKQAYKAVRFQ